MKRGEGGGGKEEVCGDLSSSLPHRSHRAAAPPPSPHRRVSWATTAMYRAHALRMEAQM